MAAAADGLSVSMVEHRFVDSDRGLEKVLDALADQPRYGVAFTGDGSFMMNPQVLIDGVEHERHRVLFEVDLVD